MTHKNGKESMFLLKQAVDRFELFDDMVSIRRYRELKTTIEDTIHLKLIPEYKSDLPLVIVISGGTNVGKSSLINWIFGQEISRVSNLARGTKNPMATAAQADIDRFRQVMELSHIKLKTAIDAAISLEETSDWVVYHRQSGGLQPEKTIMIDSPDFDSDHARNRRWAQMLFHMADAVIFVVTPEKYNDAIVVRVLNGLHASRKTLMGVFNKLEEPDPFDDFLRNIWKPVAQEDECHIISRISRGGEPDTGQIQKIRTRALAWSDRSSELKLRAIEGSLKNLNADCRELAEIMNEQAEFVESFNLMVDRLVDEAVQNYLAELKSEKFIELDMILKRILQKYRTPVIEDFYDSVKNTFRSSVKWVRSQFRDKFWSMASEAESRRLRESQRLDRVIKDVYIQILKIPSSYPPESRRLIENWITRLPETNPDPHFAEHWDLLNRQIDDWIQAKSDQIDQEAREKPYYRNFLIGIKTLVQAGVGIAGMILTGGLSVSDLIVGPLLERSAAIAIEKTMGTAYCRKLRKELWKIRQDLLRRHLLNYLIKPVLEGPASIHIMDGKIILDLLEAIPAAGEFLS